MNEYNDIFAKNSEKMLRKYLRMQKHKLKDLNLRTAKDIIVDFYENHSLSVELDRSDEALSFSAAHMNEEGLLAGFEYVYRPKTFEPDQTAFRLRLLGHYPTHENLYGNQGSGIYYQEFSTADWDRIKWGADAAEKLKSVMGETGVYQFLKVKNPKYFRISHAPFYGTYGHL